MEQQLAKLIEEINFEVKSLFVGGKINHLSDLTCSIGAVVASFLAAILVALGNEPKLLTAIVAGLSGFFATLQRVVDFRGRAAWYFVKAAQLRDISLNAKYQSISAQAAAKHWGEIERKMEERWPEMVKIGVLSEAPQSSSKK